MNIYPFRLVGASGAQNLHKIMSPINGAIIQCTALVLDIRSSLTGLCVSFDDDDQGMDQRGAGKHF